MNETDEHETAVGAEATEEKSRAKRLKDFADLQDENAGRDTGKARRFTARDNEALPGMSAQALSWMEIITTQLHTLRLQERLDELDRASREALKAAEQCAVEEAERLQALRERASLDRQGRRVYRTADGKRAFYEDGQELDRLDAVDWQAGSPTWEQYQDSARDTEDAIRERDDARDYREKVENAQGRLDSEEPLSADDLDQLEADLEAMPDSVRRQLEKPHEVGAAATEINKDGARRSAAHEYLPARAGPDIAGQFSAANNRQPPEQKIAPAPAFRA